MSRRAFLLLSSASGLLCWTHLAAAQTIPVMFWRIGDQSLASGVIAGSPIASGPIGGAP